MTDFTGFALARPKALISALLYKSIRDNFLLAFSEAFTPPFWGPVTPLASFLDSVLKIAIIDFDSMELRYHTSLFPKLIVALLSFFSDLLPSLKKAQSFPVPGLVFFRGVRH